jgi:hypothetical protein
MVRRLKGKQAVFTVRPAPDWRPQRLWDWPPTFTSGRLVTKNLHPRDAAGAARTINKVAMEQAARGEPIDKWALYVRYIRPKYRPLQGQKGGQIA